MKYPLLKVILKVKHVELIDEHVIEMTNLARKDEKSVDKPSEEQGDNNLQEPLLQE